MKPATARLWTAQNRHPGDREALFRAVAEALPIETVLYPGCYVDIAASFVFDDVTYSDMDRRAGLFFTDQAGVGQLISENTGDGRARRWTFVPGDYTTPLGFPTGHYDLLVSLYAGFVSEFCTDYLKPGGWLLVNSSHGDAAMASISNEYTLAGVIEKHGDAYRFSDRELDSYLRPTKPAGITPELLHRSNRGISYTRSPAAYVFQKAPAAA